MAGIAFPKTIHSVVYVGFYIELMEGTIKMLTLVT
jgi:hypothetical protein